MLDAYTIKKILPRLIIAVIGIQLSIYLCQFMIDISNVAGQGIRGLFAASIPGLSTNGASPAQLAQALVDALPGSSTIGNVSGIGGAIAAMLGAIAAAVLFPALALALALIILPMIFSVLITLIIRQIIIVALVVVSPIALLLWVLPNTEKYAKQWFSIFARILLMFPIIQGLYVVSAIVGISAAARIASGASGGAEDAIGAIVIIGCLVAPLAAIPFTFRFAGSLITGVSGAITNAGKKMAAPGRKWAMDTTKEQAAQSRHGTRFNTDTRRGRFLNRMGQIGTGRFGITDKGRSKRSAAHVQHALHGAKELNEAGINNHHALNAIAASHGDLDAAEAHVRAQHLDPHDQQIALDQLNLARSVKMTREGRVAAAGVAVASQGRISAAGIEGLNAIEDRSARASTFRTVQEAAKAQGQFEASLGTGMDANGEIYSWDDPAGRGAAKFQRDMVQLTTSDIQRAKTSTGDLMPRFLPLAINNARNAGDTVRQARLNDQVGTWNNYHSAQTNIALENTLAAAEGPVAQTPVPDQKLRGYAPDASDNVSDATRRSGVGGPPPAGPTPPPLPPPTGPAPPGPVPGPPPPAGPPVPGP